MNLILSLFPGIGLLDRAFEEQGFCVVRGPDLLWGGDVKQFHPPAGRFDGVIGGPPCKVHSALYRLVRHNAAQHPGRYHLAEDLIPEFERCIAEAVPEWFLMENVPAAPEPIVPGYQVYSLILNNRWLGEDQNRVRRFSFGTRDGRQLCIDPDLVLFESQAYTQTMCASGSTAVPVRLGGSGKPKKLTRVYGDKDQRYLDGVIAAQSLPHDFLKDSPFTVRGKVMMVGNGVPLPMGRAIARAVKRAMA